MKVFISGPMRNKPDSNKEAFFDAEYKLKRLGYSVFNPAWCQYSEVTEFTKDDMHAVDFAALERCDAIYMLKGWQYSKGARAEYFYAKAHGLKIFGDYTNYQPDAIKSIVEELAWDKQYDSVYGLTTAKFDDVNQAINDIDRKMNNRHADTLNKINGLKKEVEAIKESIGTDDLQEQLDKDFDDVYDEFQSVKDKVNDIEFGYIEWSSKMSSAIEDIEETRKHIMSFYDGEFIDTFNKVDDRLKKLEKTVNGLNSIVGELGNSTDNMFENQCELNSDYAALNERLKKIENLVADTDVDYLEARVRGLENKAKDSETELNVRHKAMNIRMNEQMTRFYNRLEAIEKRLSKKDDD